MSGQFLILYQPSRLAMLTEGPTAAERTAVEKHLTYLKVLAEAGRVVLAGRTTEDSQQTFGIAVIDTDTAEQASCLLSNDPAILAGVMTAELRLFRIAVRASQSSVR